MNLASYPPNGAAFTSNDGKSDNAIVEKHPGVSATMRSWNTIATLCEVLEK